MSSRPPIVPCDESAEWGALGALIDREGAGIETVSSELFFLEGPQRLAEALRSMVEAKIPVLPETVARQFGEGGVEAVAKAMDSAGPGLEYWLPILREKLALRSVREVSAKCGAESLRLNDVVAASGPEIRALCGEMSVRLASIASGLEPMKRRTSRDLVRGLMRTMQAADAGTLPPRIPTGIPSLDKALGGGLKKREMSIVAARTSVGKSAFAGFVAASACRQGDGVLYAIREMDPEGLMNRFLCLESGVAFRADEGTRPLSKGEWAMIAAANARVDEWPLEIRDDFRTISEIRSAVMESKPKLVIVDHVGIFHADGCRKGATSTEQASFISHQVRDLAFELDVAVLALCQINRQGAEEPTVAHLKDSGSLEEDARVVLILHRNEEQPGGVHILKMDLAKNTNGANRVMTVRFNAPTMHFHQIIED